MKINTVTGPIDTADLGKTLMHEHILCANHTMVKICPNWYEREPFVDYAVRMIQRAKVHGVKTIVDMTCFQLGRDASILREVAEKAEINLIACSGYYWFPDMCLIDKSAEYLAEIMINDIEKGMEGTDMKPGVIKACTGFQGMDDYAYRYLKAAAIAHKATGLPISTHTTYRQGIDQVKFFEEHGVDMSCVLIGHMGDTEDLDYITSVLDRCGFIGFDRFCIGGLYDGYTSDEVKIGLVEKLAARGDLEKLTFSHDCSCLIDNWDDRKGMGNIWQEVKKIDLEKHKFQFDCIVRFVLPEMLRRGFTQQQIDTIMVDNPRRFFEKTGSAKY